MMTIYTTENTIIQTKVYSVTFLTLNNKSWKNTQQNMIIYIKIYHMTMNMKKNG